MWAHVISVVFAVCMVAGLYALLLCVTAFIETKSAPRKPMVWCDKHGAMMEEYMIDFMGQKCCAICFHSRMKEAERAGSR